MKVSFFIHRWKKESEVISLEEFVNDIRGPRWKVATEAYRGYLQRGMQKEAADIKEKMNGIVAAGTCRAGMRRRSGEPECWMMFDFDPSGTYTGRLLELLRALPYVGVAFISISGEGVKALVRIEVDTLEEYKTAYKVVGDELCRRVGFTNDGACSDLGRICSAVYDPEVYYRPDAEPFAWRDLAPQFVPVSGPVPVLPAVQADGFIRTFLNEFAARNPFVRGTRHDFMLKLGRVARYKGFSQRELADLIGLATSEFTESDYLPEECLKDIMAGYQYVNTGFPLENPVSRVHKGQRSPLAPSGGVADDGDEEALFEKNNELQRLHACFSGGGVCGTARFVETRGGGGSWRSRKGYALDGDDGQPERVLDGGTLPLCRNGIFSPSLFCRSGSCRYGKGGSSTCRFAFAALARSVCPKSGR